MLLFRPTGLRELQLVLQRDLLAWPPRLPDQPIFYPVTNATYAEQIAREWNTKSELRAGYVTEFAVDDAYASQFDRKVVGARTHEELWVPAEQLEEFNRHIAAPIRVISAYFGQGFVGLVPTAGGMRGRNAREQLVVLAGQLSYSYQDFHGEVTHNRDAVFLHLPCWRQVSVAEGELPVSKDVVLEAVEKAWASAYPELPLPGHRDTLTSFHAGAV
jgi:hypothetical protein